MADLTSEEVEWLRSRLHGPDMKCRQCDLTRRALTADLEAAWDEGWEAGGAFGGGEPQSANPYRVDHVISPEAGADS